MACRCDERRARLAAAVSAARSGHTDIAKREVAAMGRTLTEDAKAFARGLQSRLTRR